MHQGRGENENAVMGLELLILTVPGISVAAGAQIVAEAGGVRRFSNAAAIVKYAGLNPGVSQSGQFGAKDDSITKKGSPHPRRALACSQPDERVRSENERLLQQTQGRRRNHRAVATACTRKLRHAAFVVTRDQVLYDPGR